MQRTVLCYGDSNTWGFVPLPVKNQTIERYPRKIRWTGILQELLGGQYYVIEEGLNGRTTNVDYNGFILPDRNGKTYLPPCLYSHAPIDLIILGLGGNDLKVCFNRSPQDINGGVIELIDIIQASQYGADMKAAPNILILPLSLPTIEVEQRVDEEGIIVFEGAAEKAKLLAGLYAKTAKEKGCYFLDVSKSILPSTIDGLHLDAIAHKRLADMIFTKVSEIFNE
jgi:lysophospholipase L1-like esterase